MATGQDSNGSERQRFLQELEFVQCLANPHYVHCKCPRARPRASARALGEALYATLAGLRLQGWRRMSFSLTMPSSTTCRICSIGAGPSMPSLLSECGDLCLLGKVQLHGLCRMRRYPHALFFLEILQDSRVRQVP